MLVDSYQRKFKTNNIFLIKRPVLITWGHVSILDADLICLEELLRRGHNWSHFINTAGTELPMMTYQELITSVQESPPNLSHMELYDVPEAAKVRVKFIHTLTR